MQRFKNQVAIIAGGARGIGKGIVERLAAEGAEVVVFDINPMDSSAINDGITSVTVDITNEEAVREAIRQVTDNKERLDIMVNCAGAIGETNVKVAEYNTTIFEDVIAVNLTGAFLMTKYSLPQMISQKYGRILHVTSIGGKEGNPGMIGYAASKSGLIGLIKGAGKEYAKLGVTVNGIAPAVIATEFNENTDPAMLKYMTDKIPMQRMGTIEEVAALACWIVSEEASFNTGFVFDISGGRATY